MTNRRDFLQIGLTASTLSTFTPSLSALPLVAAGAPRIPLYKVVYDRRYRDSAAFAQRIAAHLATGQYPRPEVGNGEVLQAITGDITPFWYKELDAIWRREPLALAGMTAHGPLFCLERLAWEKGMRVVWRCEHRAQPGGIITHTMSGPDTMLGASRSGVQSIIRSDSNWSEGVAALLLECPLGQSALGQQTLTAPLTTAVQQDGVVDAFADPLISWIIAPARRA